MNFKNKNGELNSYALACGYVEHESVRVLDKEIEIKLSMEHSHYHVMCAVWDVVEPHLGCIGVETDIDNPRTHWRTYDKLSDARKAYNKLRSAMFGVEGCFETLIK